MNYFECCHHCVPPKRYPGCHGKCKTYLKRKEEYDRLKSADLLEKRIWGYAAKSINARRDAETKHRKSNRRYMRSGRHD